MNEFEQLTDKYDLSSAKPSEIVAMQRQETIPGQGLDLSKVTPQQLQAMQREDPGALQRGAARFAGQPAQAVAPAPDIRAMFQAYMTQPRTNEYGTEVKAARDAAKRETDAFNNMIKQAVEQPTNAPSKAEMYFRLAAAFGAPTRTGAFSENLAGAAGSMAEFKKEESAAMSADRAAKMQLGLAGAKNRVDAANTDLATVRTLASEEMRDDRALQMKMMEQYIASGKPQSESGKRAVDSGLKPGTPEYNAFVEKDIKANLEKGDWYKDMMAGIAGQNLALNQAKMGAQQAASKKLTPKEMELKTLTEDHVGQIDSAIQDLQRVFELNPNTFDASLVDKAQRLALEAVGSKDKKLENTRTMENLLQKAALSQLKSTFPGAISNEERKALLAVQGLDAKTIEERKIIIANAYKALKSSRARAATRLSDINAGNYRDTVPALPEELN